MWEWVGTIVLAGLCWAWLVILTDLLQGRGDRLLVTRSGTSVRDAIAQTEPRGPWGGRSGGVVTGNPMPSR